MRGRPLTALPRRLLTRQDAGSLDLDPLPRSAPCQYDSCPRRSGEVGSNATDPRLNWVNSFPVTGVRYGLEYFGPLFWGGAGPDLAVAGPNVGGNTFLQVPFSGTVGAAVYAAARGVPAVAFSGAAGGNPAFDTQPVPARSEAYARLAARLVDALAAAGPPYLPPGVWLNVNFPDVETRCPAPDAYRFVLSRINPGFLSAPDAALCGGRRLPTETEVLDACHVSVSPGDAADKTTVDAERQAIVAKKLRGLLSCL